MTINQDRLQEILGYDPDQVIEEAARMAREGVSEVVAEYTANPNPDPHVLLLLIATTVQGVQIAYLMLGVGRLGWPSREIYAAVRAVGAEAAAGVQ